MVNVLHQVAQGVNICIPTLITCTIARFVDSPGCNALSFGYLMTEIAKAYGYGVHILASEKLIFPAPFGRPNLSQMHLQQQAQSSSEDEEQEASPQQAPPPAPSIEARLTAIEQGIGRIAIKQSKMEKLIKKTLQYLSNISKSCRPNEVEIPASPSPPPPDSG